jgi:hypothetical protein
MECERCGKDTETERYDIDGFTGHLCDDCREAWDALQSEE